MSEDKSKGSFLGNRRAGGYAVTTVHSMPWLSSSSAKECKSKETKKGKGRRQKAEVPIENQIFADCSMLVEDPFWKETFNQAAMGRFPRGFMFKDNSLTYKRGSKVHKKELPLDPLEACMISMTFFKEMAGIRSQADQDRERLEIEEQQNDIQSIENCGWDDIKKKKIKELLISEYISTSCKDLNLDIKQKKKLITIINIGFLLGYLDSDKISFTDGKIYKIDGLEYNDTTREFTLNISPNMKKMARSRVKAISDEELISQNNCLDRHYMDSVSFIKLWKKFLESLSIESSKTPKLKVLNTPGTTEEYYTPTQTPTRNYYTDSTE